MDHSSLPASNTELVAGARQLVRGAFTHPFPLFREGVDVAVAVACREVLDRDACVQEARAAMATDARAAKRICTDTDALLTRNSNSAPVIRSACGVDPRSALDTVYRDASGAVINTAPAREPLLHEAPVVVEQLVGAQERAASAIRWMWIMVAVGVVATAAAAVAVSYVRSHWRRVEKSVPVPVPVSVTQIGSGQPA